MSNVFSEEFYDFVIANKDLSISDIAIDLAHNSDGDMLGCLYLVKNKSIFFRLNNQCECEYMLEVFDKRLSQSIHVKRTLNVIYDDESFYDKQRDTVFNMMLEDVLEFIKYYSNLIS